MVIELSGVQFGLKSYAWFEVTSMISDQNCTTRNSITTLSILKSHNFMVLNFRFWSIVPSRAGLVIALTSYLVCKTMSCDENSLKHNKQPSSEVRMKTASFMPQSSILVAWIIDGRPSFFLWLRRRLLIVFGEGIWGCSWCNSVMDFVCVMKLPQPHDARLWRVFSFTVHWHSAWF